ncbi:MAG TPA: alpha/beta hydrolase [Bryobacteraceae bacterium]|jgi:acetyl esterase/lipase
MLRRTFLGAALCGAVSAQSRFSRPPDRANIPYGPSNRTVLDLWQAPSATPTPLVIYFHGGEYVAGDKSNLNPGLLDGLLAAGISVAAINFRYAFEFAQYPFTTHDPTRAVQFLRLSAPDWNLDPERFGATGVSSGGTMALWIGLHDDIGDPKKADPVLRQSTRLSAVAVQDAQTTYDPRVLDKLIGPTVFQDPSMETLFGYSLHRQRNQAALNVFTDASPANHLSDDAPPVLLLYSEPDTPLPADAKPGAGLHHPRFGYYLKERMDARGIECSVVVLDKPGMHPTAAEQTVAFFKRHFGAHH